MTNAGILRVLAAPEAPVMEVDFFSNDNEAGRRMTTEVVLQRGARDIVLIEEDLRISTVTHRVAGFRQALEQHGVAFARGARSWSPLGGPLRGASLWRGEDAYTVARDLLDGGRATPRPSWSVTTTSPSGSTPHCESGVSEFLEDVLVIGWGGYPYRASSTRRSRHCACPQWRWPARRPPVSSRCSTAAPISSPSSTTSSRSSSCAPRPNR